MSPGYAQKIPIYDKWKWMLIGMAVCVRDFEDKLKKRKHYLLRTSVKDKRCLQRLEKQRITQLLSEAWVLN